MLNKQRLTTFVLGGASGAVAGIPPAPQSRGGVRGVTAPERAGAPLPTLGSPTVPGPVLGYEPPAGAPAEASPEPPVGATPGPPPLRDVSWDAPRPAPGEEPDPQEIRRKIQETRSRLRARLENPGNEADPGDDPGD